MQVKNIVVGTKYQARDGSEKTKWQTIGACFIKDDGKMSIKLEYIPVNWDGNAQIFDREQRQAPQQGYQQQNPQYGGAQPTLQGQAPQMQTPPDIDLESEIIPF